MVILGGNHDLFDGAAKALRAWMEGEELIVRFTLGSMLPCKTTEDPRRIQRAISGGPSSPKNQSRVIWLGPRPIETEDGLMIFNADGQRLIRANADEMEWIMSACDPRITAKYPLFHHFHRACPSSENRFWKLWITMGSLVLFNGSIWSGFRLVPIPQPHGIDDLKTTTESDPGTEFDQSRSHRTPPPDRCLPPLQHP